MQQMAGNMGLLNPFIINQIGTYGPYATQVHEFAPLNSQLMQQQAALVAATTGPAAAANATQYVSPMTGLPTATQINPAAALNGLVTPTSGMIQFFSKGTCCSFF